MLSSPILGASVSGAVVRSFLGTGTFSGNKVTTINDSYKSTDERRYEAALRQEDRSYYEKDRSHSEAREDALRKEAYEREEALRKEAYEREDTAYSRLFNELTALGINPHSIFSSVSASGGSRAVSGGSARSSGFPSYSGRSYLSQDSSLDIKQLLTIGILSLRLLNLL